LFFLSFVETFATLGSAYAGLYGNSSDLKKSLIASGEVTGDRLWELPMGPFFAKQIESQVADMKNVGLDLMGENGAAAEFLQRFVGDLPWAHIDIAGVSWNMEEHFPKGVTGFGVRLLYNWLLK
jgi:leucyl aminopeptidase